VAAGVSHRQLAILVISAALVGTACTSRAAMVQVGSGERYLSIDAGLKAAQPGDTVLVSAGQYDEHALVVDKAIVLLGRDHPVIDAHEQGEIIMVTHDGAAILGGVIRRRPRRDSSPQRGRRDHRGQPDRERLLRYLRRTLAPRRDPA